MPHYTDEQASAVFARDRDEVFAYYQRLAEQQRPAVARAIANLTGTEPAAGSTAEAADPAAAEGDDSDEDLEGFDGDEDPALGDELPEELEAG